MKTTLLQGELQYLRQIWLKESTNPDAVQQQKQIKMLKETKAARAYKRIYITGGW